MNDTVMARRLSPMVTLTKAGMTTENAKVLEPIVSKTDQNTQESTIGERNTDKGRFGTLMGLGEDTILIILLRLF